MITKATKSFSTTKLTKFACGLILLAALPLHAADPLDPDARLLRLERWIKASLAHHPGDHDTAAMEVSLWSNAQLRVLLLDERVLARVLRRPQLRISAAPSDDKTIPPYTAWQIRQFNELVKEYVPRNDHDDIIVRGALLHGDIAMSSPRLAFEPDPHPNEKSSLKILFGDGESLGFSGVSIHWAMARSLFDRVKDDRVAADIARRWYIATSTLMQNREEHDTVHLTHGREMFPDDVELQFLSGVQHESYASPYIQSAAKSAVLPQGYFVDIESEQSALRTAEGFLRRALTLEPRHQQAHLHLGHVLLARGKPQEAAVELRQVTFAEGERDRRYFGAMFLGAAEEAIGRFDEAHEAYARAATLVPSAQSPLIALSALAGRRGDRAGALAEIERVFTLPTLVEPADPWWSYRVDHTANVDELLATLFESVGDARK